MTTHETQLARDIRELLPKYEAWLRQEYGGDKADKVVNDAKYELGEFVDWLMGGCA